MSSIAPSRAPLPGQRWPRPAALIVSAVAVAAMLGALAAGVQTLVVPILLLLVAAAALIAQRQWPFALMLAMLAWLPFQNLVVAGLSVWLDLPLSVTQMLVLAKEALLAGLLLVLLLSGRLRRWGLVEIVFAVYLIWVLSYLPRGGLSLIARLAGARVLAIPVLLYLVGRYLPAPLKGTSSILRILIVTSVIVAVCGWAEWLFVAPEPLARLESAATMVKGGQIPILEGIPGAFYTAFGSTSAGNVVWVRRMISTYLEALTLGHALILPFAILYYALVGPRPRLVKPRWLVAVLLVLVGTAQVMALSRGALLASLLAAVIITISQRRARLPSMIVLAVGLSAVLLVPRFRGFVVNTIKLEDPSTIAHVNELDRGLRVARQNPFGFGLGQGGYVGNQYAGGQAQGSGESFYFSMISQVGLAPMALYSLGVLLTLWELGRVARRSASHQLRGVALVVLAAVAGYSLSAIFSEAALGMLVCAAVWFLAGHVIQLGRSERVAWRSAAAAGNNPAVEAG